jgi:hypothetical protein
VTEQDLDDADVGVLFQEVGGEAVPQRVHRHPLLDPGGLSGGVDGAIDLTGRERLDRVATGKQPAPRQQRAAAPALDPPITQQLKQLRRQHGVAIFAAFALLDPQQHALGVDVADLECDHLGDAQAGAVGRAQRRLVLRTRRRLEQQRDLLDAQHGRQPERLAHHREPPGKVRPVKRRREEEAQGRDRVVDARRLHAALPLVQLEAAQILRCRRIGRPADEGRERPHMPNVVGARLLSEAAHHHVFDHARTQRADGPGRRSGGHRGASRAEGCWTCNARDRMPRSSPLTAHPLIATAKNPPVPTSGIPRERVRSWEHYQPNDARRPVGSSAP